MKDKNLLLPLLVITVLAVLSGCEYPLLLLAAVLVHEVAHVIAAVAVGAEISLGKFLPCGLVLEYDCHLIHPAKEAMIAAAGVLANALAAAFCLAFADMNNDAVFFVFAVNAVLAGMNMLPISGFDGAVIAERLLAVIAGPMTAAKIISAASDAGSVLFTLFTVWFNVRIGLNISMLVLSLYLDFSLLTGSKKGSLA